MERTFGGTFLDLLDTAGTLAIQERFNEQLSDRSEGQAENANPQTVTQPVHPSQLPSGQPIHNTFASVASNPLVLALGGVVVLVAGIFIARLVR